MSDAPRQRLKSQINAFILNSMRWFLWFRVTIHVISIDAAYYLKPQTLDSLEWIDLDYQTFFWKFQYYAETSQTIYILQKIWYNWMYSYYNSYFRSYSAIKEAIIVARPELLWY